MLIMPIGNGKIVVNVKVELKNKYLLSKSTFLQGLNESEVIIGNKKFSQSLFSKNDMNHKQVMNFIRHNSINSGSINFTVSTRKGKNNNLYDVYSIETPANYVNEGLEYLFGAAITDLRRTIPDSFKGRNISLKQYNILENIDRDRMKKFRDIATKDKEKRDFSEFKDFIETLDFLRLFDFEIIENSAISKETFEYLLYTQKPANTDTYKSLKKYYKQALENEEIYRNLVFIHRSIYNEPYNLIHKKGHIEKKDKQNTKKERYEGIRKYEKVA